MFAVTAVRADVLVLQNGAVVSGKILQQENSSILFQTRGGAYRYPLAWVKEARKEDTATPRAANNGQAIPDWAQIVTLLADSGFAPAIQQVPATVINYGKFRNVPYVSFRCGYGGYEINVFGDLDQPAAIEIGAMNNLHDNAEARSNCVHFISSVLANTADRKVVQSLNWSQNDVETNGGLNFETVMPGEWGSYGGWWISVCNPTALDRARATDAELMAIAESRTAATNPAATSAPMTGASPSTVAQPIATTSYPGAMYSDGTYSLNAGWTPGEIANAHGAAPNPDNSTASSLVYPRTYSRTDGVYGRRR